MMRWAFDASQGDPVVWEPPCKIVPQFYSPGKLCNVRGMASTDVLILEGLTDARRVRIARAVKGFRQIDVAVHACVSVAMVSFLERGFRIPAAQHEAIFRVLGLQVEP